LSPSGSTFKNRSFWLAHNLDATDKAEAESLVVRGGGTLQRGSEPGDANFAVYQQVRMASRRVLFLF
jgi:hypothetical protein